MIDESCHRVDYLKIDSIPSGWISQSLIGCRNFNKGGLAVFAQRPIARGELLVVFGGAIIHADQLRVSSHSIRRLALQIDDDLFMVSSIEGSADWVNHSCDPNAGLRGQVSLVSLRDINIGEEICYDYAMSDGSPYDEFDCVCGSAKCRGRVTGDDWKIQELWDRYGDHFSPYLHNRRKNRLMSIY